ncbi:MAG: hypothetical protein AB7Q00_01295 [Phycisphaerales bacterium]
MKQLLQYLSSLNPKVIIWIIIIGFSIGGTILKKVAEHKARRKLIIERERRELERLRTGGRDDADTTLSGRPAPTIATMSTGGTPSQPASRSLEDIAARRQARLEELRRRRAAEIAGTSARVPPSNPTSGPTSTTPIRTPPVGTPSIPPPVPTQTQVQRPVPTRAPRPARMPSRIPGSSGPTVPPSRTPPPTYAQPTPVQRRQPQRPARPSAPLPQPMSDEAYALTSDLGDHFTRASQTQVDPAAKAPHEEPGEHNVRRRTGRPGLSSARRTKPTFGVSARDLRKAIILREVLGPPIAEQDE